VWHAPLILQGYNYPGFPLLGVLAMVAVCTGMSFVLTALRELTGSLLPVAAAHGMLNGIAPILLILAPDAHPVLFGPLGLLGASIFALVGAAAWTTIRRRATDLPAAAPRRGPRPWPCPRSTPTSARDPARQEAASMSSSTRPTSPPTAPGGPWTCWRWRPPPCACTGPTPRTSGT
jgi:hypothetical protein